MTNIRAFNAVHYNLGKITDLSQVVCPPYDVISKEEQDFYYRQSPFNFIRLILNKPEEKDNDANNKYTRPAMFFNEWLKEGILIQDLDEAIYFYKQDYFCDDKEYSRVGFIALLQITDTGIVLPHENTHHIPKMDRLELIKKVKANLSPIFTMFFDKEKIIENIFNKKLSGKKPDFLLKDTQGIRNSLWRITGGNQIENIAQKMKGQQIFIADGHHRYEVASMYLKLMKEKDKDYSLDKSYNYIMAYFTPAESSGISIMPIHRIIKQEINAGNLKKDFKITGLKSIVDLDDKLNSSSKKSCVFGLYYDSSFLLLELKNKKQITSHFIKNTCFRDLDVAILDFYVLSELLKIKKDDIIYTKDINEAKEAVDNKNGFAAFILRPTTVKQIKEVAVCGEKMPPKSTYFYPKLLSGLVVHRFSEATTYGIQ